MKRNFIKLFIFIMAISLHVLTPLGIAKADDIIYGDDQRQEVEDSHYSHLSKYLVAMVDLNKSKSVKSYGKKKKLCTNTRFFTQPSISKCSGILIKGKYILTAAHCVSHSQALQQAQRDCSRKGWLLDYQTNNGVLQAQSYKMVHCKRLVEFDTENDYALIEIKTKQPQRVLTPTLKQPGDLREDHYVSLGFPSGLPMKSSDGSFIKMALDGKNAFFNFDTSQGSSGSPVFNQSGELLGVLKSGKSDLNYNKALGCYELNQCDNSGLKCGSKFADQIPGEGVLLISKLNSSSTLRKLLSNRY